MTTKAKPASKKKKAKKKATRRKREGAVATLRKYALGLPGTVEEFPWGDRVVKVNKKIFVFLGQVDAKASALTLTVKLPHSAMDVLDHDFAEPTGYGLGKSGWVTMRFANGKHPPLEVLESWVLESYRAVAPKKFTKLLGSL